MSWYKIEISLDDQIKVATAFYQEKITEYWKAHLAPTGLVIISSNSSNPKTLYFSPEITNICEQLLIKKKGTPCNKPEYGDAQIVLAL